MASQGSDAIFICRKYTNRNLLVLYLEQKTTSHQIDLLHHCLWLHSLSHCKQMQEATGLLK